MSFSTYYCHNCRMGVTLKDGDIVCERCGSDFVEELSGESRQPLFQNPVNNIFSSIMADAFGQSGNNSSLPSSSLNHSQQPTSGSLHIVHTHGNPTEENVMMLFLNQLLANLSAQGAQIQLQIAREPFGYGNMMHGQMGDYAWGDGGLDQIVTQLLNQFEGGTSPVDPKLLVNLPMILVDKSHVDGDVQCTTCMEMLKEKELVARLDCQHMFHRDCIVPWLRRHNTCPICRQVVDAARWPSNNPLDELD